MKSLFLAIFMAASMFQAGAQTSDVRRVPDCIGKQNQWPGQFSIEFKLSGRTAEDVAELIDSVSTDPLWPDFILANRLGNNHTHTSLSVTVEPHYSLYPGMTIEQLRPKIEKQIANIMAQAGVTVTCPTPGE